MKREKREPFPLAHPPEKLLRVRRAHFVGVLFLLGCATVLAQEQKVSVSVVTTDKGPMIKISNMDSLPVEAFLVTADDNEGRTRLTRIYYDVHSSYRQSQGLKEIFPPIPPGTSKQVPLPHLVGKELPDSILRAVVFSNGMTLGDEPWVNELLQQRSILADRLREITGILQYISDKQLPRDEAITLLRQARDERKQAALAAGATPEEQARHDQVFLMALMNLGGEPRPTETTREVMTEVDSLKRIGALIRIYSAWLADIQNANPPISGSGGPSRK
jgi:hypothetical protein